MCVCARVCVMEGDQIRARPVAVCGCRALGRGTDFALYDMYPPEKKAVQGGKHALRERREFVAGFQLPHFSIAPVANLPPFTARTE